MSQYWGACFGDALVLDTEEFQGFLTKYQEIHGLSDEELEDVIEDRYNWKVFKGSDQVFEVTPVLTDDCDGMVLVPFKDNGEWNVYIPDPENPGLPVRCMKTKEFRMDGCYAVFADKNRYANENWTQPVYQNPEEIYEELKALTSLYLPEDFDWEGHIGQFSYASYA